MRRPNRTTFATWWEAQAEEQMCSKCGKTGHKAYVQPQHPYYSGGVEGTALCSDCLSAHNEKIRAQRKAEIAAAPRCEANGCKRRGTYLLAGRTLTLCGRHVAIAKENRIKAAGPHAFLVFLEQAWTDRGSLLRFANGAGATEGT